MGNNRSDKPEEGLSPIDESWWSALLAEEERYISSNSGSFSKEDAQFERSDRSYGFRKEEVDWQYIEQLFARDETITLTVSGFNRGGLLVETDEVHGFVPISHLVQVSSEDLNEQRDQVLSGYVGRTLYLKVIECEPERGRVVFSERAALASTGRRIQLLNDLKPGDCVSGVVTNITDFGIFIDLGGVEGLVHVSEISWGRVRHPSDAVRIGQQVTAYVIQIDQNRSRIALSLKRLCNNPWDYVGERYEIGQIVEAEITSVVPFGAFARLEEGLDGLIHITEMGCLEDNSSPEDIVKEGQVIQVVILHIDADRQRLGLSLNHNR